MSQVHPGLLSPVISRQHLSPIIRPGFDEGSPAMMSRTAALLHGYAIWVRRLPLATGTLFAARSPWGRSFKIFLFGVGVVLPLGSLIWALLYWHGRGVCRCSPSRHTFSHHRLPAKGTEADSHWHRHSVKAASGLSAVTITAKSPSASCMTRTP